MSGKGSGRLHARQQCTDEEMQSNWDRIFKQQPTVAGLEESIRESFDNHFDALAGSGDTFEEKVSLSDEMQLHGEKHKPEGK